MKIANKISLSFLITALILTAIAAPIFYTTARNNLENAIFSHLKTTAQSRRRHIETLLEEHKQKVKILASDISFQNSLKAKADDNPSSARDIETSTLELKEALKQEKQFHEIFALNPDGEVVISTNESTIGLDKSTDAYFLGGKEGVYIKDAYYSKTTGKRAIAISTPILDSETREFLGVLVARVELTILNEITADMTGLGMTGKIYIVNKHGYMITPSKFKEDTFLKQKVDTENTRKYFEHIKKFSLKPHPHKPLKYTDYRGIEVLGLHDHIYDMQWCLCAEINEKEALAPLAKIKILFVITITFVPIAAWLIGVFVSKLISGPIHKLHSGTEAIGKGNLDYKVGTDAKNEIGQLSRAFDEMTNHLKQSTTSIDNLNKEITERKRVEEALRESKQRFRSLVETTSDWVWEVDQNAIYTYSSPKVKELLGYEPEEIIGKLPLDLMPTDEAERVSTIYWDIVASQKPFERLENVNLHKDGQLIVLESSGVPIFDDSGGFVGYRGIDRDITERKKAEQNLQAAKEQAELIYRVVPSAIFTVDTNRCITSWNNKAAELTGYTAEEVIGKECTLFALEPCCHKCNLYADDVEKPVVGREYSIKRKDGQLQFISKNADLLKDENGNIIGGIESFENITEHKQAQTELQTAQDKLIDTARQVGMAETATDVLHNVGNVLNSVSVTTASIRKRVRDSKVSYLTEVVGLLEEHADDLSTFMTTEERGRKLPAFLANLSQELITEQERYLEALETLTKHVEHTAEIIRLQQSYSKTTGMVEPASVVELVEDAIRINAEALTRHGVEVKREFADMPPTLLDHHKALQILINLISNAKYALSDSGRDDRILTICVKEPQGGHFRIEVHDNGIGITEENVTRIFEHGFTTKKHGYGFGLHSAAIAANEMNGSLTTHSDGSGKGTVFTLELPFQTQETVK